MLILSQNQTYLAKVNLSDAVVEFVALNKPKTLYVE